jgi:hypothetical protein
MSAIVLHRVTGAIDHAPAARGIGGGGLIIGNPSTVFLFGATLAIGGKSSLFVIVFSQALRVTGS